eukprot:UN27805
MLYIGNNKDLKGGELLLPDPRGDSESIVIKPETGRAVVFDHKVYHSGAMITEGQKFAVRLDVLYKPPQGRTNKQKNKHQKQEKGNKRSRRVKSLDVQLSKALSTILRHKALKLGLTIDEEGYVPLKEIEKVQQI